MRRVRVAIPMMALALSGISCTPDAQEEAAEPEQAVIPRPAPVTPPAVADPRVTTVMYTAEDTNLLQSTISAAEGGLTTFAPETAIDVIQQWQTRLRATESPPLISIADDLDMLQRALRDRNLAPETVGPILIRLGEKTQAAALTGAPEARDQLGRLGTLLAQAGNQLSGT